MDSSQKHQRHQDFLGNAPIGPLLMQLSVPAMVGMLVNALYNLVDTIFIGHGVGTDAIGGLSLAFPAQMIVMAMGMAIGTGAASIISRRLGAGDNAGANKAAGNAFGLAGLLGLLTALVGSLLVDPILVLLGASAQLTPYARDYLQIILLGSPFIAVAMTANNIIRAEGRAKIAMGTMVVGAIANLILDPILIFGFDMGIQGAAIATIAGQALSFIFVLWFFASGRSSLRLAAADWRPCPKLIGDTLILGFPAFIRQGGQSIVIVMVNNLLGGFGGDLYIAAMGIINRLLMFVVMPLFGLVHGMQPIVGYNYGAKRFSRVRAALALAVRFSLVYASLVWIAVFAFPAQVIGLFSPDPALLGPSMEVMQRVFMFFPLIGLQILAASLFQSIGKALPSLLLNLSRQFLLLIPLLLILPAYLHLAGVLWAFPIADISATVVTIIWLFLELRRMPADTPLSQP